MQALERENERLHRAVDELSVLNELATAIGAARNVQEIMQTIVRRSLRAIGALQGDITLVGEDEGDPARTLIRTSASSSDHNVFRPSQSLLGWMHLYKSPLLINDPRHDDRFRGTTWHEAIQSILCVPLVVHGHLIGVLSLYNKKAPSGFTEGDQRLLSILAAQSAQVIENARLYEEEKKLLRFREEHRLAQTIQTNLLPRQYPVVPGYDIAGTSIPAQIVGGDYFDYIPIDEHHLALCVGDVSGKGIPAALLMASLQATLRGQAPIHGADVRACVQSANRLLCNNIKRGSFITLFYGVLDRRTHHFRYVNAGHNRPLFCRPGAAPVELATGGLILGFLPGFEYKEGALTFAPGDALCIYSDGVTEAMNTAREQFDEPRLLALLRDRPPASSEDRIEQIVTAVRAHTGTAPQTDDITLLMVQRRA